MKTRLSIIMAAGLIMYPFAAFAQDYGSPTSSQSQQQAPPVAQTLVREGDFAIRLAAELNLGNPTDEASAESLLTVAGIAPENGWLSDYPVTPEIIDQLQIAITRSASEDKILMSADQGTRKLYSLASQMTLPVPAGSNASTQSAESAAAQPNPTVIYNYYYDEGPPVITYYPPPYDYFYLYDWVPYPVWWVGFWFPGFYICHDFTTTVVVTNGPFVHRRAIVSNHVIDPISRRVAVVTPIARTNEGRIKPVTMLRTENGALFRTVHDMRTGPAGAGGNTRVAREKANQESRVNGYTSSSARNSAASIYSRSYSRSVSRGSEFVHSRNADTGARRQSETRSFNPGNENSRSYNSSAGAPEQSDTMQRGYGRTYAAPPTKGRGSTGYARPEAATGGIKPYSTDNSSRRRSQQSLSQDQSEGWYGNSIPSRSSDRSYTAPSPHQRSFDMPARGRASNRHISDGWWSGTRGR